MKLLLVVGKYESHVWVQLTSEIQVRFASIPFAVFEVGA